MTQPPKGEYYFASKDSYVKEDVDIDVGYYIHKEKLGEGGFSKVRLGTHLLTGEKVAIKCMEKEKLGEDLFRVQTEIKALKVLHHENIAKLLQVIETDTKIYLILEYCSGGELFDYIVSKSRLSEIESQKIMSSLVEVLAYMHSNGFAHRDLKPENILFDSKHKIKLIDFGLAGQSKENSLMLLKTCCGSPAYAAPELISGNIYSGPLVDVWSAGVILYTLLVGKLPFEDENLTQLYKKIQTGIYHMPMWLSKETRSVINSMLQVNPKNRTTIQQLLKHPWINAYRSSDFVEIQKEQIDEELLWQVHKYFQTTQYGELRKNILTKYGYQTATYWLLKEKNKNLLSPFKYQGKLVYIPTNNLTVREKKKIADESDKLDKYVIKESAKNSSTKQIKAKPIVTKQTDTPTSKVNKQHQHTPIPKNQHAPKILAMKRRICEEENEKLSKIAFDNKESNSNQIAEKNNLKIEKDILTKGEIKKNDKENDLNLFSPSRIPVAIKSPVLSPLNNFNCSDHIISYKKPRLFSPESKIPLSKEINNFVTPSKDKNLFMQTPKKSLLRRLLATATPGTNSANFPRSLNLTDSTKNLTMTKFTNSQKCIDKIISNLTMKGLECKQKGFVIRCAMNNKFSNVLTFNLEICEINGKIAIQRKRLRGDAWNYKKICEEILRISNEDELSSCC